MKENEEENLNEVDGINEDVELVELSEIEENDIEGGASSGKQKVFQKKLEEGVREYKIPIQNNAWGYHAYVVYGSVEIFPSRYYEGQIKEYTVRVKENIGYGTQKSRVAIQILNNGKFGEVINYYFYNIIFDLGKKKYFNR